MVCLAGYALAYSLSMTTARLEDNQSAYNGGAIALTVFLSLTIALWVIVGRPVLGGIFLEEARAARTYGEMDKAVGKGLCLWIIYTLVC